MARSIPLPSLRVVCAAVMLLVAIAVPARAQSPCDSPVCNPSAIVSDGRLGAASQYFNTDWHQYFINTDNGLLYRQYSNYPWDELPSPPKRVISQPNGPDIMVFDFTRFDIAPNVRVWIVGSKPAAIVASEWISIAGRVYVSANGGLGGLMNRHIGGQDWYDSGLGGAAPPSGPFASGGAGGQGRGGVVSSLMTPWGWMAFSGGGGGGGGAAGFGAAGANGLLAIDVEGRSYQMGGGLGGFAQDPGVLVGGGGGGQGGGAHAWGWWPGGMGGSGGGAAMFVTPGAFDIGANGELHADGTNGAWYDGYAGGGGGGGGGYLLIHAARFDNNGIMTARGGAGSAFTQHSHGGGGAGGRIVIAPAAATNNGAIDVSGGSGLVGGAVTAGGGTMAGTGSIVGQGSAMETAAGTDVVVQSPGTTFGFTTVTTAGTTRVVAIDPASAGALPRGYRATRTAYEISTTAQFSGPVTVCFYLPQVEAANFANLRVLHGENNALVDRTVLGSPTDPDRKLLCAQVESFSPFVIAEAVAAPTHLWHADYVLEYQGPRTPSDQILDGLYSYTYFWNFGILNDPTGPFGPSSITVTPSAGLTNVQAMASPGTLLTTGSNPATFTWSVPSLDAVGVSTNNSMFGSLRSGQQGPAPYALGYDAARVLSPQGRDIAGGASEQRSVTVSITPRDATLTNLMATVQFDPFGPAAPVVTVSNVACQPGPGRLESIGPNRFFWQLTSALAAQPLPVGQTYSFSCTFTVTNTHATATARYAPSVMVRGDRFLDTVAAAASSHSFTSNPAIDPEDALGTIEYTVTPAYAGEPIEVRFDRRFGRSAFLDYENRLADSVPPVTARTIAPAPNADGWNNSAVTLHLSASDSESGVKEIQYAIAPPGSPSQPPVVAAGASVSIPVSASGSTNVSYFARDFAGNSEAPTNVTIRIDTVAPVTTINTSPVPNSPSINVSLNSSDAGAGPGFSGVKRLWYSLSGAQTQPLTFVTTLSTSFVVSAFGTTTVTFYAEDRAGNIEAAKTRDVTVQKATPTITLTSSAPTTVYGGSVVFTAQVSGPGPTPTGAVTFRDGPNSIAVPLNGSGIATLTVDSLGAGSHTIVAEYGGNATYTTASASRQHDVSPAPLTIAANDAARLVGTANPPFTATFSGFVLGQGPGVLAGTLTFSTTATPASPAGAYAIVPSGVSSPNYAITFVNGTLTVSFNVCALYDQTKSHRAGSTVPIKVQLCTASGANLSAAEIQVTAVRLWKSSASASSIVIDAGNANPDGNFRYDAESPGYIFNLKTTGLDTGTYHLGFTAGADPVEHVVTFQVR